MTEVSHIFLVFDEVSSYLSSTFVNRFLNGGGRPGDLPRVYKVDSSNYPQGWDEDCHNPAAKIVQSYIDGEAEVSGMEPIPINLKAHSYDDTRKMYTCELCNIQVSLTCGFKTNSYIKV